MAIKISVTKKSIIINLINPFYDAGKLFGYKEGITGFSISEYLLDKAINFNLKIIIIIKTGSYICDSFLLKEYARRYQCKHKAASGMTLYIFPDKLFTKLTLKELNEQK